MALKVGELFATMTLRDEDFSQSLNAIITSLERAAQTAQKLTQPAAADTGPLTAQLELCVNTARQAGMQMNNAAAQALLGSPALLRAAASLGASIQPALTSTLRSAGNTSGRALGDGLVNGINSRRGAVAAAAARLARAAVSAVRSAIRQGSPSKVMFESGSFFGEGFANGVSHSVPLAQSAARTLADAAVDAASVSAPRMQASGASAGSQPFDYDRLAEAMGRWQMNLMLDGRKFARLNADESARAQTARERSLALGYYGIARR